MIDHEYVDEMQSRADAIGDAIAKMARKDICTHGALIGTGNGRQRCRNCAAEFESFEDAISAHARIVRESI